jgi:hypothetical protein
MVTIKGGVLKGGTTRKKKHYMDDRKPQQMRATGYSAGTKPRTPKQLEGALGSPRTTPRSVPRTTPRSAPTTAPRTSVTNTPKAKPSSPMPASIPRAQGKAKPKRETSISISRETAVGKVLSYIVSGPASRTVEDRKKRANQIRSSYK